METEAWPFLVSRNRYLDYRTVVAPGFITGSSTFLSRTVGGDLSKRGQATCREIHGSRDGDITLVFRVIEANGIDIGKPNDPVLKDSFGRTIYLIEGIAIRGKGLDLWVREKTFDQVHQQIIGCYRAFWNIETPAQAFLLNSFIFDDSDHSDPLQLVHEDPLILEGISGRPTGNTCVPFIGQSLPVSEDVTSLVIGFKQEILAVTKICSLLVLNLDANGLTYAPCDEMIANGGFEYSAKYVVPSAKGEEFVECYSAKWPFQKGRICAWNRITRKSRRLDCDVNNLASVAISPDNCFVAACYNKSNSIDVWTWDEKSDSWLGMKSSLYYNSLIESMRSTSFAPDSQSFATGHADGSISIWQPMLNRRALTVKIHMRAVTAIAISSNGQLIASGDKAGNIVISRFCDVSEVLKFDNAHKARVNDIAFSPDGTAVVSGSSDGTVKLLSIAGGETLFAADREIKPVTAVAFVGGDSVLASAGSFGYIRIWRKRGPA